MSDPFWKTNGKDDFTKFFGSDSNAMLELKLSVPPDRPTLHENLLASQTAKSKASGEDFLFSDGESSWNYGQWYRVNKATNAIYPRFDPKFKHRDSNFTMPVNHVRTILFISKQADTELGEDTKLARKGWTPSDPKVPYYFVNDSHTNFPAVGFKAGGKTIEYQGNFKRIVADYVDSVNHPEVTQYGSTYFAQQLGFDVKGHTFPMCKESLGYFDTEDGKTPDQYGPPGAHVLDARDTSPHFQGCIAVK